MLIQRLHVKWSISVRLAVYRTPSSAPMALSSTRKNSPVSGGMRSIVLMHPGFMFLMITSIGFQAKILNPLLLTLRHHLLPPHVHQQVKSNQNGINWLKNS